MTRDDILRWARESRLYGVDVDGLDRFAALVAAHEREACAQVCDAKVAAEYATGKVDHNERGWTEACAAAIRARGGGSATSAGCCSVLIRSRGKE